MCFHLMTTSLLLVFAQALVRALQCLRGSDGWHYTAAKWSLLPRIQQGHMGWMPWQISIRSEGPGLLTRPKGSEGDSDLMSHVKGATSNYA